MNIFYGYASMFFGTLLTLFLFLTDNYDLKIVVLLFAILVVLAMGLGEIVNKLHAITRTNEILMSMQNGEDN